jgi:pimeloyl-ACP methyl ester carboxylesterase
VMSACQKIALGILACIFIIAAGCGRHKPIAEVKKKKINDVEIAYYTRGSGPPLVMVMGFRGTMGFWDPVLLEALEKHYTLILFDNRGVGLSSDTDNNLTTIQQMTEDTAELIKSLGLEKAHVLGWSMGSMIALQLAISHPELVDKLILCSSNPGKKAVPRTTDAYGTLTSLQASREQLLSTLFPSTAEGEAAASLYLAQLTRAVLEKSVPDDLIVSPETIERQKHAIVLWQESNDIYSALPTIKTPTLVAGGLSDVLDRPENVAIVAHQIPFAWTAYFPGAGHAFLFQDAQHFAELVHLFISSS